MSEFDPYYQWLGIRDARRPPDCYRLLGLEPFESDVDVIISAYERQLAHIRSYQTSPQASFVARLQSELSSARQQLLTPALKAAYDAQLRTQLAQAPPTSYPPASMMPPGRPAMPVPGGNVAPGAYPPGNVPASVFEPLPPNGPAHTAPVGNRGPVPSMPMPPAPMPPGPMPTAPMPNAAATQNNVQETEEEKAKKKRRKQRAQAREEELDFPLKVNIPPAVYVIAIGGMLMALFAGVKVLRESWAKQVALAAKENEADNFILPADTNTPPPTKVEPVAPVPLAALPPPAEADPAIMQARWMRGSGQAVWSVGFSPTSAQAISAGPDKVIRWWNLTTGEQLGKIDRHTQEVTSVKFTADGSHALSTSLDKSVRYWDLVDGSQVQRMLGHTAGVQCADFIPSSRRAVTGGIDGTLRVWDYTKGELDRTFTGHKGPIHCVSVSPDGRLAATGGSDVSLRVWDLEGDAERAIIELWDRTVFSVAFNADGTEVAYGSSTGAVRVYNTLGEELGECVGHTAAVRGIAFLPDSRLISASEDGTIRFWSSTDFEELERYTVPGVAFHGLQVQTDGRTALAATSDGTVRLWNIVPMPAVDPESTQPLPPSNTPGPDSVSTQRFNLAAHTGAAYDVAFAADGNRFGSVGADGRLRTFTTADGKDALNVELAKVPLRCLDFSPNGNEVLAGGEGGLLGVWNAASGEQVRPLLGHLQANVGHARYTVNEGQTGILSTDDQRGVFLFNADSGQEISRMVGAGYGDHWALSADGSFGVSGGYDKTLRVWLTRQGREYQKLGLPAGSSWMSALALSGDGRRLVCGGPDKRLMIWDMENLVPLFNSAGPEGKIRTVAISKDGKRALSAGEDLSLRLWDVAKGRELDRMPGHEAAVLALAFSPDGKLAVSGDAVGSVRLWKLADFADPPLNEPAMVKAPPEKQAKPNDADLATAAKEVLQKYTSNAARLDATGKATLAGELFIAALGVEDNAALRYALLNESRMLAAQGNDLLNADEALKSLAATYEIDPLPLRSDTLQHALKAARTPEEQLAVTAASWQLLNELENQGHFDVAQPLMTLTTTVGRKIGGATFGSAAAARATQLKTIQTEFDKRGLKASLELLSRDPSNPAANLEVAQFTAFVREDWDSSVPMFALSSEAAMRAWAVPLLEGPASEAERMNLGQRLAEMAGTAQGVQKELLLRQAFHQAQQVAEVTKDEALKKTSAEMATKWLGEWAPKSVSLLKMPPLSTSLGAGTLGTGGLLGHDQTGPGMVVVRGSFVPDAISLLPTDNGSVRLNYRLFGQFESFRGMSALNDTAIAGPLTANLVFRVLGDGQELFQSDRLEAAGETQEFLLDVTGIDKLELSITCNGPSAGAHALWLFPTLTKKNDKSPTKKP